MSLNRATTTMHSLTTKTRLFGLGLLLAGFMIAAPTHTLRRRSASSRSRPAPRRRRPARTPTYRRRSRWRPTRLGNTVGAAQGRHRRPACRRDRKPTGGAEVHGQGLPGLRLPGRCAGRNPQRVVRRRERGPDHDHGGDLRPHHPHGRRGPVQRTLRHMCRSRSPASTGINTGDYLTICGKSSTCDTGPGGQAEHATVLSIIRRHHHRADRRPREVDVWARHIVAHQRRLTARCRGCTTTHVSGDHVYDSTLDVADSTGFEGYDGGNKITIGTGSSQETDTIAFFPATRTSSS